MKSPFPTLSSHESTSNVEIHFSQSISSKNVQGKGELAGNESRAHFWENNMRILFHVPMCHGPRI